MKATDELRKEHDGIELMLRVLQSVAGKFKSGESVNTEHLDGILEFLTIFVDKCHHGKEEKLLFPALEVEGVAREGGPIGVMLSEHEQGRKLVARFKDTELFEAYEQLERERIGIGKHDEFHALLNRLESIYLGSTVDNNG